MSFFRHQAFASGRAEVAAHRWLKPGGALLPDVASMFIAAAGPGALDIAFWDSVYGFSMTPIGDSVRQGCQGKAVVTAVAGQDLLTDAVRVQRFDLATMAAADADFHTDFHLRARTQVKILCFSNCIHRNNAHCACCGALPQHGYLGSEYHMIRSVFSMFRLCTYAHTCSWFEQEPAALHTVVLWFDVEFSARFCRQQPVVLSTSPYGPQTHWAQTVLALRCISQTQVCKLQALPYVQRILLIKIRSRQVEGRDGYDA